jgi:5-methyltetrahydrofolate--homocysteine methyltransferase
MIIIGEKINASIPSIKQAVKAHDADQLKQSALMQEDAGAHVIDINVGTGEGTAEDEKRNMAWLVDLLKIYIKGQLCIDSADPTVLEAGIRAGQNRVGLINSVKATDQSLSEVLPLVAQNDVSVIALAMNEKGIPMDVSGRIHACEKIIQHVEKLRLSHDKVFFDPIVMPVSTDTSQGIITIETLDAIRKEFPETRTVLALSNISYGLPCRSLINTVLLHLAMYYSVDAVIMNPLDTSLMAAIRAGQAVFGQDKHCRKYTRSFRKDILKRGVSA